MGGVSFAFAANSELSKSGFGVKSESGVCVWSEIVILGGSESGFGAKVQKGSKKVQKGSFLTEALGICQKGPQKSTTTEAAHKR